MSDKDYSKTDALKIALNLEKDGYDFYITAAARARDSKVKETFTRLANEEKRHLNLIRKIQDGLIDPITYFISDEPLVEEYLRRIIETKVFSRVDDINEILEGVKRDEDAIRLAMQAEKESLDFFSRMAELTRNHDGKITFKELAGYEERHLGELERLKEHIAKKEGETL